MLYIVNGVDKMNFRIGNDGSVRIVTVFEEFKEIKDFPELCTFVTENDLFKAQVGDIYSNVSFSGENIILVGLGKEAELTMEAFRIAFYNLGKALMKLKVKSINIAVEVFQNCDFKQTIQAMTEGLLQSEYRFEKYLTKKKIVPTVEDVAFNVLEENENDALSAIAQAELLLDGVFLARDLVNEPAIYMTPKRLAMAAKNELSPLGVTVDILGRDEVSELNMDAFLAVSKGSTQEPQFIVMTWNGNPDSEYKTAFVGKGLTYDSGGYSIKPSSGMVEMKSDRRAHV